MILSSIRRSRANLFSENILLCCFLAYQTFEVRVIFSGSGVHCLESPQKFGINGFKPKINNVLKVPNFAQEMGHSVCRQLRIKLKFVLWFLSRKTSRFGWNSCELAFTCVRHFFLQDFPITVYCVTLPQSFPFL